MKLHSEIERQIGELQRGGVDGHALALLNRCSQIIKGFEERMPSSEAKHEGWRPVSEKPPRAGHYLCVWQFESDGEAKVVQRYFSVTGRWDSGYVTHWRPLPEPPSEYVQDGGSNAPA